MDFAKRSSDALVLGAGVIGSSITLQLARLGYRVTCIDKLPAPGCGSTSHSSGICRSFYSTPQSVALAWEGYHHWINFNDELRLPRKMDNDLVKLTVCGGLLTRSKASEKFLSRCIPSLDLANVPYEEWSPERVKDAMAFNMNTFGPSRLVDDDDFGVANGGSLTGGLHIPDTGYIEDPQLATRNIVTAAIATKRAEFEFNTELIGAEYLGGRIFGIKLACGDVHYAPIVVNCTGAYSRITNNLVFAGSGVDNDQKVLTQPLRVETAHVDRPRSGAEMVVSDFDVGCFWRPGAGGQVVISGIQGECDPLPLEYLDSPNRMNPSITDQWTNNVYRAALRMPELKIPNSAKGSVSLLDVSDDWAPIYDRASLPGYYMAIGTCGNQFNNALIVGKFMAAFIEHCEGGSEHETDPFKYKMPYTSEILNLGTFSRLRSPHNASDSVIG